MTQYCRGPVPQFGTPQVPDWPVSSAKKASATLETLLSCPWPNRVALCRCCLVQGRPNTI